MSIPLVVLDKGQGHAQVDDGPKRSSIAYARVQAKAACLGETACFAILGGPRRTCGALRLSFFVQIRKLKRLPPIEEGPGQLLNRLSLMDKVVFSMAGRTEHDREQVRYVPPTQTCHRYNRAPA